MHKQDYLCNQGKSYNEVLEAMSAELSQNKRVASKATTTPHLHPIHKRGTSLPRPTLPQVEGLQQRRELPIKPKEKVFDEWAAVMQHQDEMTKEAEMLERVKQREKKRKYREELKRQREEAMAKEKSALDLNLERDKQSLLSHAEAARRADEERQVKNFNKKVVAKRIMEENLISKQRILQKSKEQEKQQNLDILNQLQAEALEESAQQATEREHKQRLAHALKMSYALQEELKKQQLLQEREQDKVYTRLHEEALAKAEKERQQYFDLLKHKQLKNAEPEQLSKYFIQEGREDKLKRDEANQLRMMQERLKQESEKALQEREARTKEVHVTKKTLEEQMERKQAVETTKKDQEREYAQGLRKQAMIEDAREKKTQLARNEERVRYRQMLEQQIKANEKKKLFHDIMSEHEKKVNALDLAAYQQFDQCTHTNRDGSHGPTVRHTPQRSSKVLKRVQSIHESQSVAEQLNPVELRCNVSYSPAKNSPEHNQSSGRLLQLARDNMKDPNVHYMRHNTYNQVYGYKPAKLRPNVKASANKSVDLTALKQGKSTTNGSPTSEQHKEGHESSLISAGQAQVRMSNVYSIGESPGRAAGFSKKQPIDYNIITGAQATDLPLVLNPLHFKL